MDAEEYLRLRGAINATQWAEWVNEHGAKPETALDLIKAGFLSPEDLPPENPTFNTEGEIE